jgi:two-component system, OmpR family, sensor histidine kinase BaeS
MRQTLRSRILFYFLVVSLSGILLTSFSILWKFEDRFTDYLDENRGDKISLVENAILEEYRETGNLVDKEIISFMHQHAMMDDLFYQLYDADMQLIADTINMHNMMRHAGSVENSDYQIDTYDIVEQQNVIGYLKIYYPENLIGEDVAFLKTIKQYIYFAAIITVILSLIFSMLFSKRLASGFNKLSKAVHELQDHKLHTNVPVHELTEEMKPLGASFNQLAETLAKEEVLRKQFTADLAHELRTPLATLRSQIEAYQDGIWEPTPRRLQQSHDELMRLVRLVNDLEKLHAAENPQIKLYKTEIEANDITTFIKDQFEPVFHEKGVCLKMVQSKNNLWFRADRDRVVQVLTNIVNNALQYTPSGKSVNVEIIDRRDAVGFIVKDEGIGIKEEDLPYLYERFYRGDKSRDKKTGGIGIGLSIVKALIDAHQGEIKIESKVNVGTTVKVYFPIK